MTQGPCEPEPGIRGKQARLHGGADTRPVRSSNGTADGGGQARPAVALLLGAVGAESLREMSPALTGCVAGQALRCQWFSRTGSLSVSDSTCQRWHPAGVARSRFGVRRCSAVTARARSAGVRSAAIVRSNSSACRLTSPAVSCSARPAVSSAWACSAQHSRVLLEQIKARIDGREQATHHLLLQSAFALS